MPFLKVNGANIFYQEYGSGQETLIFSHGYFFSHKMFEDQINVLKHNYRIIAYDHRGQGKSEITPNGYDISNLTKDAHELIIGLGLKKVHFIGLSMGGFIGMRLAVQHSEVVKSLILINTSAEKTKGFKLFKFRLMKYVINLVGFSFLKGQVMGSLFGKPFLKNKSNKEIVAKWRKEIFSYGTAGLLKNYEGGILRPAFTQLQEIMVPTLIIGGESDTALSPRESRELHKEIPNSILVMLENIGHSSTIESPDIVTKTLHEFLIDL